MSKFNGLGNLGELFPDQEVRCMNPRCRNTWTWFKQKGDDPTKPPRKLCEKCEAELTKLEDKRVVCEEEGCEKTWTWTAKEQLYHTKGKSHGYCQECAAKHSHHRDIEVPCRIKECDETWVWTRREQERSGKTKTPRRLCEKCFEELNKFKDKEIDCKINACNKKWTYTRMGQLLDKKSGKDADYVPRRMCSDCMDKLKTLKDREVPCRVKECNHTWKFSTYAQLEYFSRVGWDTEDPQRMCPECFDFMNKTEEREINCKNKGCDKKWTYKKRMQLHDKLTKRKNPTYRMCNDCFNEFKNFKSEDVPCKYAKDGCENTWTWEAYDKFQAHLKKHDHAPSKACPECTKFLAETKSVSKKCTTCDNEITFTPAEQLLQKLGKLTPSEQCSDCLGKDLTESTHAEKPSIVHHTHVVKLPAKGAWNKDAAIRELPSFVSHSKLEQLVDSEVVIVVCSDELAIDENEKATWPEMLQEVLTTRHPEFKTVVVNSSIAHTTSGQAANRIERDILPFEPNVTLFSFDHNDSKVKDYRGEKGFETKVSSEKASAGSEALFKKVSEKVKKHKAYMTITPFLPELGNPSGVKKYQLDEWTTLQQETFDKCQAHAKSLAHKFNIPILDLESKFEVQGKSSAKKWMKDWYQPNESGIKNIANWAADYIESLGLYD